MDAYLAALIVGVLLSALWIGVSRHYPRWEKGVFGYSLVFGGVLYVRAQAPVEERDHPIMCPGEYGDGEVPYAT